MGKNEATIPLTVDISTMFEYSGLYSTADSGEHLP